MEGTIVLDKCYILGYSTEYKFKINCGGYYNVCYANEAPTGNCQLFTLTCVDRIFEFTNYEFLIKEIIKRVGKNLMMVDIVVSNEDEENPTYKRKLRKIFKEDIVMCKNYNSTNGSIMCIMLINVSNYLLD